jgi:hypothetical protein
MIPSAIALDSLERPPVRCRLSINARHICANRRSAVQAIVYRYAGNHKRPVFNRI